MITLNNLTAGYDRHPALHHLSLTIPAGALVAVLGPNGSGKTTLLRVLLRILPPMAGTFTIACPQTAIAWLPQQNSIARDLPIRVLEAVLLGYVPRRGYFAALSSADLTAARAALATVGLEGLEGRPVQTLSAGQWQRLLFARLLVQQAELLLMDEPFAAVDTRTTNALLEQIQAQNQQGRTQLVIMHELELARQYFPTALLLAREMVAYGPTAEVIAPANLERAAALARQWQEPAALCRIEAA